MNVNRNFDYSLLVWKKMKGDISAEEMAHLSLWLEENSENRKMAASIEYLWRESGQSPLPELGQFDMDGAFNAILQKADAVPQSAKTLYFPTVLRRIAAIGLLLVGAYFVFQKFQPAAAPTILVQSAEARKKVALPDGTSVWLRKGATLEYGDLTGAQRQVRMTGEAYFEVAHNPEKPFVITTDEGSTVKVLGTKFLVQSDVKKGLTTVSVESGKVAFTPIAGAEPLIINGGQQACFDKIARKISQNMHNPNLLAWQSGTLSFQGVKVKEALQVLSEQYEVNIKLDNDNINNCSFSSPFVNQPVDQVLEQIARVFGAKVLRDADGNFALTGGSCR